MLGQKFANQLARVEDRPQVQRNCLYVNRGDASWAEVAQYARVEASDWSWCPIFLDVDLDGYEDILIGASHLFDTQDMDAEPQAAAQRPPQPAD
jgi:hypothetical protein